eukprot:4749984-Pyramimonas_sp.AAC.1
MAAAASGRCVNNPHNVRLCTRPLNLSCHVGRGHLGAQRLEGLLIEDRKVIIGTAPSIISGALRPMCAQAVCYSLSEPCTSHVDGCAVMHRTIVAVDDAVVLVHEW